MKIIKQVTAIMEVGIGGRKAKEYSEKEYEKFANQAMTWSIIVPPNAFSYAIKAKQSKNPEVVRKAEKAETIATLLTLPIALALTFGIGSWLFSGTWLAIIPIGFILLIAFKVYIAKKK